MPRQRAEVERVLQEPENAVLDAEPPHDWPWIDYRPIVAVVSIVIFSLALIAFVFTPRAH